jgi:hypothetical protein
VSLSITAIFSCRLDVIIISAEKESTMSTHELTAEEKNTLAKLKVEKNLDELKQLAILEFENYEKYCGFKS